MKKENILVVALIAIALAGIYLYTTRKPARHAAPPPQKQAPAFASEAVANTVPPSQGNATTMGNAGDNLASNTRGNGIGWKDYTPGLARAKKDNKNVFLYFHAQWCTYCTKLKKTTFRDPKVLAFLAENFVSISVDTDRNQSLSRQWRVKGLPTMWFLTPDGKQISSLPGYVGAGQMLQVLKFIHTKSYDTMSFQEFVNKG